MTSSHQLRSVILDVETANPPHSLTQQEVLASVAEHVNPSNRALHLYRKFLSDEGIFRRSFAWDDVRTLLHESVDEKMERYERWAVRLAAEAARKVLLQNSCPPVDINAVFVSTCTGYLCPGLSTYVSQAIGLPEDVYTLDLVGLGCAGALPALRAADDYLNRYPDSTVLVIAAEICSAAIHWDERPELILSNSIFGDGAAAVLLTNRRSRGLRVNSISSLLWPQFRDELRFKYLNARLCNVISPNVDQIVARAVRGLHRGFTKTNTRYAFHSSGRKILDAIQKILKLSDQEMAPTRDILREYGNMSSPSVLFALKNILRDGMMDRQPVIGFSFGAGFSASMLLAEWQD